VAIKCPKCEFENPDTAKFCSECAAPLKPSKDVSVTRTLQTSTGGFKKDTVIARKYKIIEKSGEGGMGAVYKTKDTKLKRTVALKFLPSELTQDKEAKKRFVQEAQAAAALEHTNICTIYEVDESEGQTFIAMSYIEGQSLKDKLRDGPLKIGETKDIALQIAEGLKEAHEKGIVHRDIKPANIMLTKKGQVKITDFGLAKLSWGADLTKPATIMGTVSYMSPEQARGEEVDYRTDIWSLGAMLYEMLSGERPFQKAQEQALIYAILNDKPTLLSLLRSDIPTYIEQVIEKALAKKVADRYQNVDDLIQDLKEAPPTTLSKTEKSIAVLPFTNMSADPEQEYFCDGITEEVINALTHIKDLRVIARTSSFAFKGKTEDIREIGKKLDVGILLEGSVRKSGERLRITAQLINVTDGTHIWSERYDREMKDVFDIQDDISLSIVDKLKVKLLGKEKALIVKRYTENLEVYNLYLKGCHLFQMWTAEGLEKAVECFEQALQKDPNYALAYAGLAEVYFFYSFFGNLPPREGTQKAKSYVKKALDIDERLAEAHACLGFISTLYDWNWVVAEQEFKRALELNSNSSIIHIRYATFLSIIGHHEEAIAEVKQARELDPLSINVNSMVGEILFFSAQFDKAIEDLQNTITMDPNYYYSHYMLGWSYLGKSMFKESIEALEKAFDLSNRAPNVSVILAIAYYLFGKKPQAEKLFNSLKKRAKDEYIPPSFFFMIYKVSGDLELANKWLEIACKVRDIYLPFSLPHTVDCIRIPYDQKSTELLKKVGLYK
jgi:serine/threonine protein kinase/Tfp pilus assembly protein PilF